MYRGIFNKVEKKERSKQILKTSEIFKEKEKVFLLGVTVDSEVNFKKHIGSLCSETQYKFHALIRLRKYLALEKARILGSTLVGCHLNYAPSIRMLYRKISHSKI